MTQKTASPASRVALLGILGAQAIAISFLESLIPALPFLPPGAKPGFSNLVVMFAAYSLNIPQALFIVAFKALFAFATRGFTAFLMSLCGGVLSFAVMRPLLKSKHSPFGFIGIGIFSALAHNLGQLIVASFMGGSVLIFGYAPTLVLFGLLTGFVTGTVFKFVFPALEKLKKYIMF